MLITTTPDLLMTGINNLLSYWQSQLAQAQARAAFMAPDAGVSASYAAQATTLQLQTQQATTLATTTQAFSTCPDDSAVTVNVPPYMDS